MRLGGFARPPVVSDHIHRPQRCLHATSKGKKFEKDKKNGGGRENFNAAGSVNRRSS